MLKVDIITLFPKMFEGPFSESIIKRAQDKRLTNIQINNLRHWATDRHQTVDDKPFGGGPGMLLIPEILFECIEDLKSKNSDSHVIYLSPQGKIFKQNKARQLSKKQHLILLCGHYEGVDQRVIDTLVDEEISIGDYVLTGGELPAIVIVDTIVRLIPGVIEGEGGREDESFSNNSLEYPQYTRPAEFRGLKVPSVLLSGNHAEIKKWKNEQRLKVTKKKRKDLL
ncbi:tRNA (guanosine(37)-N1)-methyltransferase TrmD [candidate division CPR3 bacterium RIFOXYC2_FULL_35_7]|nr:MAG: tRNA (guanosine(37)-N1)-methyltransferase TrmD [candidate division CPR3 bacterium RIFOXYC2_FULL_35_7]